MKINTIKKQNNKYIIELENTKITTYDEVIIKNNILYKKELTQEQIKKIEEQNKFYEIYEKILKYINRKLRSEYEIKTYIEKENVTKEIQNKIIKKLKQTNQINDELYAKAYIHDKIIFANYGPYKIKEELKKQNIDEEIIEKEIQKLDEQEIKQKLEKQIKKRITTKYSEKILKQKILNEMIKNGYKKENIIDILEQIKINNEDTIKKEYEKIYNKLKNKYNDKELKLKIKQKLYQKGFELEEINKLN